VQQPFKKRFKKKRERERESFVCMYVCIWDLYLVITYMHCKKKKIAFSCREEKMNAISQGSEVKKREREYV